MATSSIFASFDIKDDATLTRFLDALEASEAEQANKPVRPIQMPLTDPEKILNFYETTRWLNVVGAYWYYFNNKKNFNKAEKKEIYNKISSALKTLERKRIKPKLKLKLGYYPFRNFKLFLMSENIYFRLKKLIGK